MPDAVKPWLKLEEPSDEPDVVLPVIVLPAVGPVELKMDPELNPLVDVDVVVLVCASAELQHSRRMEKVASFRMNIHPL